jgi:glycosyltransferase involved in cell wall biosynthesis
VNVLIGSGFPYWNAEADYAARLARLLRGAGHGAWIAAPPGSRNAAELAERGLEPVPDLLPSRANPLFWPRERGRLREFLTGHRIDVVNVFRSAEWPLHLWAARGLGTAIPPPAVVRTRGGALPERRGWLSRRLYGDWGDGLIVTCELIRNRLRDRLQVPDQRMRTIYFPVDLPPLPSPAERRSGREAFLRELGLEPDRFAIAVVGRIAPEKGHESLMLALAELRRRVPEAALLIVNKGYPSEAPHRARIERLARESGLESCIRWLGFRPDVRRIMSWADAGVIPSLASEMNCRVAVEFLSVGTPVVAYPTGALPEVVEHEISGLVTARPSPHELADALARLHSDSTLRDRLGLGARRQAERRFSESLFLDATLEAFQSALAKRRGPSASGF